MSQGNFGPVGADAGSLVRFGDAVTARTILEAGSTAGGFSVVEHVIAPKELVPHGNGRRSSDVAHVEIRQSELMAGPSFPPTLLTDSKRR